MKLKSLLLALVLSGDGVAYSQSHQVFPSIENINVHYTSNSNAWSGHSFHEIIPPSQVKRIILLEDRNMRNLSASKASPEEIQKNYNQLFSHLEGASEKAHDSYFGDNEYICAQFAVVTMSNDVIRLQTCGNFSKSPAGMLISGRGIDARINVTGFQPSTLRAPQPLDAGRSLPGVEVNYLPDQKPGDWSGQKFAQIIQPGKIKRIILLEEDMDILDRFVRTPGLREKLFGHSDYDRRFGPPPAIAALVEQKEHDIGYGRLFDCFEAATGKAEPIHLAGNEVCRARLLFLTDSDEVIYLEIVTTLQSIGVSDSQITGVLMHGSGKGVRINLTASPSISNSKNTANQSKP